MHAYALHNKPRRYVKFLLIIMLGSLIGLPMYGGDVENNRLLHLNVAHMRDRADLIVTGSLQLVGPYRESSKSFYNIMAHEVLKGSMPTNCLLVVHTDIYSYQGSDPNIEAQVPYILFLEKLNLDDKKAPPSMVCYQVSGTWKGIIPLDKKANERRAIVFIKRDYGVNILERLGDFKEAIRYSINKQKNRLTQPPEDLNPETFAIYEGLKLGESNDRKFVESPKHDSCKTKTMDMPINVISAPATIEASVQSVSLSAKDPARNALVVATPMKPIREIKKTRNIVFSLLVVSLVVLSGLAVLYFRKK